MGEWVEERGEVVVGFCRLQQHVALIGSRRGRYASHARTMAARPRSDQPKTAPPAKAS